MVTTLSCRAEVGCAGVVVVAGKERTSSAHPGMADRQQCAWIAVLTKPAIGQRYCLASTCCGNAFRALADISCRSLAGYDGRRINNALPSKANQGAIALVAILEPGAVGSASAPAICRLVAAALALAALVVRSATVAIVAPLQVGGEDASNGAITRVVRTRVVVVAGHFDSTKTSSRSAGLAKSALVVVVAGCTVVNTVFDAETGCRRAGSINTFFAGWWLAVDKCCRIDNAELSIADQSSTAEVPVQLQDAISVLVASAGVGPAAARSISALIV